MTGYWPLHPTTGEVKIWSGDRFDEQLSRFVADRTRVHTLAFTPDSKVLITGGNEGVKLWDVGSGEKVKDLTDQRTRASLVSRDGRLLGTIGPSAELCTGGEGLGQHFEARGVTL